MAKNKYKDMRKEMKKPIMADVKPETVISVSIVSPKADKEKTAWDEYQKNKGKNSEDVLDKEKAVDLMLKPITKRKLEEENLIRKCLGYAMFETQEEFERFKEEQKDSKDMGEGWA